MQRPGHFSNVFVLCTGRCGSTTFAKAAGHIKNFTAAHESRSNLIGAKRFGYPERHIEVDNRLSWLLGRLDQVYGDSALYVHLKRDEMAVAQSFTKRYGGGIIKAYRGGGIIMGLSEDADPLQVSLDYCRTVTENIALFLRDKSHKMEFNLENYEHDFPEFWERVGASGKLPKALSEFSVKHNASH